MHAQILSDRSSFALTGFYVLDNLNEHRKMRSFCFSTFAFALENPLSL